MKILPSSDLCCIFLLLYVVSNINICFENFQQEALDLKQQHPRVHW